MYSPGMTAVSAPMRRRGQPAIAVLTIAGPLLRLTPQRILQLSTLLLAVAAEPALSRNASSLFPPCGRVFSDR